jgi:protein-L-isoaspartate(D-aspartate) O-methyltransferase
MVETQIAGRGIRDRLILDAMRSVPREAFVGSGFEEFAYEDGPLSIGEGQTISQPYIVALMIEAAEVKPGETVLEVGAGSGYASAVISRVAARVHAIERHASLADKARERLATSATTTSNCVSGTGRSAGPRPRPFDAILVAAGGPEPPRALKATARHRGRLVIPVGGNERHQTLLKVTRVSETSTSRRILGP